MKKNFLYKLARLGALWRPIALRCAPRLLLCRISILASSALRIVLNAGVHTEHASQALVHTGNWNRLPTGGRAGRAQAKERLLAPLCGQRKCRCGWYGWSAADVARWSCTIRTRDGFHVPCVGLPMSHIRAMFGVQPEGQVGVQTWSWVVLERLVFIRQPK